MQKNLIQAIKYLPVEFYSDEIIHAAILLGDTELINYFPDKYLTQDNLSKIIQNNKSGGRFSLEKIPVELRSGDVCKIAVKNSVSNFMHVPEKEKTAEMLYCVMNIIRNHMEYLDMVPSPLWDTEAVFKGIQNIYTRSSSSTYGKRNRYFTAPCDTEKEKFIKLQILLYSVPAKIKNKKLYHGLYNISNMGVSVIEDITPRRFKDDAYYALMAKAEFYRVPLDKITYGMFLEAINNHKISYDDMLGENSEYKPLFDKYADAKIADALAKHSAYAFGELPENTVHPRALSPV